MKVERRIDVYAGPTPNAVRFVRSFPIQGASGTPGPKLRAGDGQVPEGKYRIESLNPNSRFHLALRLDYPNAFDKRMAKRDRRSDLGGDIMIHGGSASIGCLALGDRAAEELFVLVADAGASNSTAIITPIDFRTKNAWRPPSDLPPWSVDLYSELRREIQQLTGENSILN